MAGRCDGLETMETANTGLGPERKTAPAVNVVLAAEARKSGDTSLAVATLTGAGSGRAAVLGEKMGLDWEVTSQPVGHRRSRPVGRRRLDYNSPTPKRGSP